MHEKILIVILTVILMAVIISFLISDIVSDVVTLGLGGTVSKSECNDLIDNDGDEFIDYPLDPGCVHERDWSETNPRIECDDGKDNDGDGTVDMLDYGCVNPIDVDETNCGDYICEDLETCSNCPEDCGKC